MWLCRFVDLQLISLNVQQLDSLIMLILKRDTFQKVKSQNLFKIDAIIIIPNWGSNIPHMARYQTP
jgi:hypothetical protein